MSELLEHPADRVNRLKTALRHVTESGGSQQSRQSLTHLLTGCDACQVAQAEDELLREGVPVEQLVATCDDHAAAVRQSMPSAATTAFPPGHPVETFQSENAALEGQCTALQTRLSEVFNSGMPPAEQEVLQLRSTLNQILDVDKHYLRKEQLLFTCLERHGMTGPSKVMWAKDDEIRALLRDLDVALSAPPDDAVAWRRAVAAAAERALPAVIDMVFKENHILLPMAIKTLDESEWVEIWAQSPQFGWCIVDPGREFRPSASALLGATRPRAKEAATLGERRGDGGVSLPLTPAAAPAPPAAAAVMFPTGALTVEQLIGIFNSMPVDLTFVDADDRVRFFSEGAGRIFVRAKAVVGRRVQQCHPPKSVHLVEQILQDFKAGRQNVAEFWINLRGRFIHIRYFAVRSEAGAYLGTLEVTQDLTRERQLEGEQRLVVYEN